MKKSKLLDDSKKRLKIGGIGAILVVAAFFSIYSGGVDTFLIFTGFLVDDNSIECVHGESGIIYQNCPLNFELSKPNRDWKFYDGYNYNVNTPKFDLHFPGQSIVDGVLVERTNNEQVLVVIFNDKPEINLQEFIEKELEFAGKSGLPIQIIYTTPGDNNDITLETNFYKSYDFEEFQDEIKERIIKKDGRVYVIHSVIRSLDDTSEKVRKEINDVFNSFEFIS